MIAEGRADEVIDIIREEIQLPLAYHLITMAPYSYFSFQVTKSGGPELLWNTKPYIEEFRNPLGKPLGPPVKDGYIFTRSFEHLDVWLNVETEECKLTWDWMPIADPQDVDAERNQSNAITLTGSDPRETDLNYLVSSQPTNGVLTGTAPNLVYTPNEGFVGKDSFTFKTSNDMAESLQRQITTLEEFGNLQRRFTSDVSHELRTPLTTVRMAADLIYDHSEDLDPALRRSTELLVGELDRFETLLNDLLEISRHDAGVAELSVEAVDLRTTINRALGNVGHLADEAGIELLVDMGDEAVIAEVDPRRVERILRNLIANAIDHAEHKPVLITMAADSDTVAVTVRDRGVGLRPGEEKLVFSRFWRSDPSRVRRSGGTGLGLAISIEDARLHQGRLEAWGEPGKGACFRLTLPLIRGHKVTTSPLPMKPVAAQRQREIVGEPA